MSLDIKDTSNKAPPVEEMVSTHNIKSAQESVGALMGHACQLLQAMHDQHNNGRVQKTYQDAIDNLRKTTEVLKNNILCLDHKEGTLTEKGIKDLKKEVKKAEALYVDFIADTQAKALGTLAKDYHQTVRQDIVEEYAKGGVKAAWIYLLSWVWRPHWIAVNTFRVAYADMNKVSRREIPIDHNTLTEVDRDRWKEFVNYQKGKGTLKHRAGVIGINGIYRIHHFFSKKDIAKQVKSFRMQALSDQERTTIENNVDISLSGKNITVTSTLVPLNKEFDKRIGAKGVVLTAVFTSIFGTKGISSMNRREGHLVNAWETSLRMPDQTDAEGNVIEKGKTLFRALRHAITSDILGSGETREKNSTKAAEELLKAALLQEIADQGLTLEEAAQKGIQLRLNSVSLVTPDDLRTLGSKTNNEKRMLLDQMAALHSFEGEGKSLTLDGVTIPIQFEANTFNFGVNAGAVGKLKVDVGGYEIEASFIKMGLELQYKRNKKAWKNLQKQMEDFEKSLILPLYLDKTGSNEISKCLKDLQTDYDNLILLRQDINTLMKDREAYLKGDNQYDIGAKILNLTNIMDNMVERINRDKTPMERLSGHKCAFNCKSGKDRTGVMDCVAKTNAIMAKQNGGYYLPHEDFLGESQKAKANQKRFVEILVPLLIKAGSLKVTVLNTGVVGYKIQEEARLFGMSLKELLEAQGLSVLTAG